MWFCIMLAIALTVGSIIGFIVGHAAGRNRRDDKDYGIGG